MTAKDDLLSGELPVDADLGVANPDDDDVVDKGADSGRDETDDDLDDVEEVLPQGSRSDDAEPLP
jgi:hypothetical protein